MLASWPTTAGGAASSKFAFLSAVAALLSAVVALLSAVATLLSAAVALLSAVVALLSTAVAPVSFFTAGSGDGLSIDGGDRVDDGDDDVCVSGIFTYYTK